MSAQPRGGERAGHLVRLLGLAAAYFGLVFIAGFVLGAVRVLWLVPRVGVRVAELLEMPLMLAATVLAARWINRCLAADTPLPARLGVGTMALGLLLITELLVVAPLRGLSPLEALVAHDPVSGPAYYVSLALFAVMPWLLSLRRAASRRGR